MFQTSKSAEVHVPKPLAAGGERLWSWITLPIHIPIFLVSLRMRTEAGMVDRMLIVGTLEQLTKLTDLFVLSQLLSVKLISPKWLNGEGDWQMDGLREVLQGKCPDGGATMVYVLENGKRYVDTEFGISENELVNIETIFSLVSTSH